MEGVDLRVNPSGFERPFGRHMDRVPSKSERNVPATGGSPSANCLRTKAIRKTNGVRHTAVLFRFLPPQGNNGNAVAGVGKWPRMPPENG